MALALSVFLTATGWGAHPWFSSRTVASQSRPVSARSLSLSAFQGFCGVTPKGPATITNGVFDIVISLYNDPPGDNDGNTQGKPGSESQDAYEYIIQYFADAVYESTEGKHSIGMVRLFRNGEPPDTDVKWTRSGGPASAGHLNNSGKMGYIEFYDIFGADNFTNNMAEHEKGGYTLAHEWGHYAYGLLDEYCVKSPGGWSGLNATNKVQPSVMNDQWSAAGRNYEWLNFSIPWQGHTVDADFVPYENRRQSAHHQAYEQSCWETLSTNTANDPLNTPYQNQWLVNYGSRVHYPELIPVAPVGTNAPRIDLSKTDNPASLPSRRELNIVWMSSNLAVELIIDRSGSMTETIDDAKAAAKSLIDQAPTGTAVGVVSFATTAEVQSAVAIISNETVRTQLKTAVDNIPYPEFDGQTAMGDAAALGLSELLAFTASNITCAAFIVSDGEYNYGADPLEVIPSYQRANVPVMGIAIGELTDYLRIMVEETGGRSYLSADGQLSSLSTAMRDALAMASGRQSLGQGTYIFNDLAAFRGNAAGRGDAARSYSIPFRVDSTLKDLQVNVAFSNAVTVALQSPVGVIYPPVLTNQTRIETQLFYNVASPDTGDWKLAGTMEDNTIMRYTIDSGVKSISYYLRGWSMPSPTVTYLHFPYPFEIYAYLQKERPINGAVVTASIRSQYVNTNLVTIPLTSIGRGYYFGVWSDPVWADYEVTVRADNSAGTAYMTSEGNLPSAKPDGSVPEPEPDAPISENFVRYDTYCIEVVGCYTNEDAPMAPIYVNATAGTFDDCVRLRWFDININFRHIAQHFEIWRSTDHRLAGAVKIGQATYPDSQYFDTNVVPGKVYYYAVRAVNPVHPSAFAPTCMGYAAGSGSSSPWLPLAADFDGDRKADPALYHPVTGAWKVWCSTAGYSPLVLPDGFLGGKDFDPVAADFDGDGLADPAVYHPSTGDWIVKLSSSGYAGIFFPGLMGNSSWVAVAGDWDGDRLADPALFCDATGEMKTRLSSAGYASFQERLFYWDAGLVPLGSDWDGDRFSDPAVCEIPTAYWEIHLSGSKYNGVSIAQLWNYLISAGSLPMAADFDGDGLADPAAYNLSSGEWQVCLSASGYAAVAVILP